jgi:hypothetical protein
VPFGGVVGLHTPAIVIVVAVLDTTTPASVEVAMEYTKPFGGVPPDHAVLMEYASPGDGVPPVHAEVSMMLLVVFEATVPT